jgi:beta-aspartyl-peptidase (threonine type)
MGPIALAIHGGCGVLAKAELSEPEWQAARADLARALLAGWRILQEGGSALDAVEAAVVVMEDSPHFNAGHGAALNAAGEHELDASIMDGATLAAGAVTLARRIRNPIRAARAVMERGPSVMLGGDAADDFAAAAGLEIVNPEYFTTERRRQALAAMKAHEAAGSSGTEAEKHGTVGAAALDRAGHLAAATSTGGFTNKPRGRIGDSPVIGAGTYASDGVCAVSGTGQGELFIRHVVGHEIASRIAYLGEPLATAASRVVLRDLGRYDAGSGAVAVDARGRVTTPYNTEGMYRGWATEAEGPVVASHGELYGVDETGRVLP